MRFESVIAAGLVLWLASSLHEWKRTARFAPMADVAVGHGDKKHMMPFGGPHRGGAAGLQFAVIRVRAETYNPQLAIVRGDGDAINRGTGNMRRKQESQQTTE